MNGTRRAMARHRRSFYELRSNPAYGRERRTEIHTSWLRKPTLNCSMSARDRLTDEEASRVVLLRDLSSSVLHVEYELAEPMREPLVMLLDHLAQWGTSTSQKIGLRSSPIERGARLIRLRDLFPACGNAKSSLNRS